MTGSPVHVRVKVALQVAMGVCTGITPVTLAGKAPRVGGSAVVEGILVGAHDAGVGVILRRPPLGILILVGKGAVLVAVAVLLGAFMDLQCIDLKEAD